MDFKGIKKLASQPITYSGTTAEEFVNDFKYLVELHLADLSEWLADSDAEITGVFEKYGHKIVADAFSEEFDRKVQLAVGKWIATDEFYRKQFFNLRKQYSKHLQLSEMKEKVKKALGELDLQLQAHVKRVNTSGRKWTESADHAGLTVKNKITIMNASFKKNYLISFQ